MTFGKNERASLRLDGENQTYKMGTLILAFLTSLSWCCGEASFLIFFFSFCSFFSLTYIFRFMCVCVLQLMAKTCFFLIYYIVVVGRARSIAHHRCRRKDRRSDTQVPRVTLRRTAISNVQIRFWAYVYVYNEYNICILLCVYMCRSAYLYIIIRVQFAAVCLLEERSFTPFELDFFILNTRTYTL